MMNSFRWSYVPKKPWSNPPNFQVASTCCPCLRQFLLQNHPLWGEAFCCPRSTDGFPMWMQDTPRRFVLWVVLENPSCTDRSLVVKKPTPPSNKMCARQNWIMNPPGFGVGETSKKMFEVNLMEINQFLSTRNRPGSLRGCTHPKLVVLVLSLWPPWPPKLPSGMGRPLQNDTFLTPRFDPYDMPNNIMNCG